ncbi:MAG: hypothetical protein EU532_10135 [Promethearchaeota archaeon]|nr:MAG: hypothetical protein EU532_10135 [Candidatus Lokiarchaeota archaeon]
MFKISSIRILVKIVKIAVDIDGVLLDLVITFCEIFNEKYNMHYTKEDVSNWEFFNDWNISEEEAFGIFYQIYENTMVVPFIDEDASKFMKKLNLDHDVYILSARTSLYKAQIIKKLNLHNIKKGEHYNELILVHHKPYDQKQNYKFDIYIDDNPHLAETIKKTKERYLLLYNQPWNQNFICKNNIIRVYNWKEVYETIMSLSKNY